MGDEHGKCQGDGVVAIHKSTIAIKTWWITPKKKKKFIASKKIVAITLESLQ